MLGVAELLQIALLALAFGCGIPALAYLAFKGNIREAKSDFKEDVQEPKKEAEKKDGDLQALTSLEMEGWEQLYAKVPIKGYIYIPKPVLKEVLREIEVQCQQALQMREKPAEAQPFKGETRKLEVRRE